MIATTVSHNIVYLFACFFQLLGYSALYYSYLYMFLSSQVNKELLKKDHVLIILYLLKYMHVYFVCGSYW